MKIGEPDDLKPVSSPVSPARIGSDPSQRASSFVSMDGIGIVTCVYTRPMPLLYSWTELTSM